MFDKIMNWASKSFHEYNFQIDSFQVPKRQPFIKLLKKQFDYDCLEPKQCTLDLPGAAVKINLIVHDFQSCLYSILNDKQLMHESHLLYDCENIFTDFINDLY